MWLQSSVNERRAQAGGRRTSNVREEFLLKQTRKDVLLLEQEIQGGGDEGLGFHYCDNDLVQIKRAISLT